MNKSNESPLAPLKNITFANMWFASLVSNIGTWMHSIGAVWLMTSLSDSAFMIALVQAVVTLPTFFFALPAGALADLCNKKTLLLITNVLMLVTAAIFAFLVFGNNSNPQLILIFTFLLGLGAAMMAPAWQSSIPQIVSKENLQQAIALGGININISRAIGPALAGVLITSVGIASPFIANAISFVFIIAALFFWKYKIAESNSNLPPERIYSAMRSGISYAFHSKPLKDTMLHIFGFMFFGNAFWALLPIISKDILKGNANFFGLLMAVVGVGAVIGAFTLPQFKKRLNANQMVAAGTVLTSVVTLAFAFTKIQWLALVVSFFFGLGWILVLSTINVSAQVALPDWVRARGLAVFMMVFFGGMSLGSAFWGWYAELVSIPVAMITAAIGGIIFIIVFNSFKLQQGSEYNLTPSHHWHVPCVHERILHHNGPVMITIHYKVSQENRQEFLKAINKLKHERKRNGAYQWGIYEDTEQQGSFVEHFMEDNWVTHLHHHERVTHSDKEIQDLVNEFHIGENKPVVKHSVAAYE